MNKRIKKKLQKRCGYKKYNNPNILGRKINKMLKEVYTDMLILALVYEKNPTLKLNIK